MPLLATVIIFIIVARSKASKQELAYLGSACGFFSRLALSDFGRIVNFFDEINQLSVIAYRLVHQEDEALYVQAASPAPTFLNSSTVSGSEILPMTPPVSDAPPSSESILTTPTANVGEHWWFSRRLPKRFRQAGRFRHGRARVFSAHCSLHKLVNGLCSDLLQPVSIAQEFTS